MYAVGKGIKHLSSVYLEEEKIDFSKPIRVRGSLNFELESNDDEIQKQYDIFNDIDILYSIDFDSNKEIMNTKLSSKFQEKDLINGKLVVQNKSIYLYLEDLYNKYIKIGEDFEDGSDESFDSLNKENINNLINGYINAFNGVFKEEYFKREKDTINYQGEKIDVYKNYFILDQSNYKIIFNEVLTNLKNDDNFINALSDLSKEDAKKLIEESIDNLNKESFSGEYEFIVYTKGYNNEFVKALIIMKQEKDWINIELDGIDTITMNVGGSDMEPVEFIWKKTGENAYSTTLKIEDDEEKIVITLTEIIETIEKVEKVNDSNAVSISELTEDEVMEIMIKISENEGLNAIMEVYEQLLVDNYNPVQNS